MPLEEWNDYFEQVITPADAKLQEILAMVVVAPVAIDATDTEELLELFQRRRARRTLRHDKLMNHLVTGSVADSPRPIGLTNEADGETSFSVHETDHPATELDQSFLLIARTAQIVTARTHYNKVRRVPDGYSGFPAYSRMLTALLPMRGAAFYLRHFVTRQTEVLLRLNVAGSFRFRPALHVAMEVGPSHRPGRGVWRMASEDSGPLEVDRPFLLIVRTGCIVTARRTG
jgi:hypothetical protein